MFPLLLTAQGDPYKGMTRTALKREATGLFAENQALTDSLLLSVHRLDSLSAELDSLKRGVAEFVADNIPAERPTTVWQWAVLILGILAKFVAAPIGASALSFIIKARSKLRGFAQGGGQGFWILSLVSAAVAFAYEAFRHPSIQSFSFSSAFGFLAALMSVSMLAYHAGLKKLLTKLLKK